MKPDKILMTSALAVILSSFSPAPQSLHWEDSYTFDRCNEFVMEFYAKGNELMQTRSIKIHYQSQGENFMVRYIAKGRGTGTETIIDKKNELAIQMFGTGEGATPSYNAGGFKYPAAEDLKKLEIIPTEETRKICGYRCKKYTYTYKKIFGEVWITEEVKLPNDVGVFRACKMAALHNTLSVPGYVMEMTTEDTRGGKTLMKSTAIGTEEKYRVDLKGVDMSEAVNKINYYTF